MGGVRRRNARTVTEKKIRPFGFQWPIEIGHFRRGTFRGRFPIPSPLVFVGKGEGGCRDFRMGWKWNLFHGLKIVGREKS
ncbi:hypothetical protein CEXT_141941 [Caerostris extrusa]|uniref:Uncharacterized protein n=1 Tax=Caerostris extrusa TaxID=172846 RepID=A0AAV4QLT2_CAEEX|nr:hypothetical protein CEXT_141941 [Caerostris extrusa]